MIEDEELRATLEDIAQLAYKNEFEVQAMRSLLIEKGILTEAEIVARFNQLRDSLRDQADEAIRNAEMERLLGERREQ